LPDEAEAGEGDEEMDQDEVEVASAVPPASQADVIDVISTQDDMLSKPPSPQPQLSMSLQTSSELSINRPGDALDASLDPLDTDMADIDVGVALGEKNGLELDLSGLGPDGLGLESSHNLSQMGETDVLIGGPMMTRTDNDPFADPVSN